MLPHFDFSKQEKAARHIGTVLEEKEKKKRKNWRTPEISGQLQGSRHSADVPGANKVFRTGMDGGTRNAHVACSIERMRSRDMTIAECRLPILRSWMEMEKKKEKKKKCGHFLPTLALLL
jgi:hypothetical protein